MIITNKSQVSGKIRSMDLPVTEEQMIRYQSGRFTIQDCFPNLSPDEREFIKSGITSEEWEAVFNED